jgi:hypothetical protein
MGDPELAARFYEARERGRVNALSILQQAAKEDWRAGAEWLRLAHRESYSTRAEISVEGAPKHEEGIVIDAAMLTRLQGAYQKTLESMCESKNPPERSTRPTPARRMQGRPAYPRTLRPCAAPIPRRATDKPRKAAVEPTSKPN